MRSMDVALYSDEASAERYEEKAFLKTNTDYVKVGPKDVMDGKINEYRVLFLPGAFPLRHRGKGGFRAFLRFLKRLSRDYQYRLREYVEEGGCLVGVCASAGVMGRSIRFPYIHSALGLKPLGLFRFDAVYGKIMGVVHISPERYGDERDRVVKNVLGRYATRKSVPVLTFRGPQFTYHLPPDGDEVMVARYCDTMTAMDGRGAVAFRAIGKGCAIACAVHPEMNSWDLFRSMIKIGRRDE